MAFVNWSETLSVKIDSIDQQHKKLFELINDFYANIQNRSNKESISTLIGGMKKYTQVHFTNEEGYMKRFNYPEYASHKKEHDEFLAKVAGLEEKYNQGKLIMSIEITSFLKDWLKNHIEVIDKKYSDFLINNGVK